MWNFVDDYLIFDTRNHLGFASALWTDRHIDVENTFETLCPRHDLALLLALFAVDELSGFIVAAALMRPTKMIGINSKSILKKMKDKRFAAAVSREDMKFCEEYFKIPIAEFIALLLPGFEKIAPEWQLTAN